MSKRLLLFVHGLRGDSHGLRFVAEKLSDKYEVVNVDLPGSGAEPELTHKTLDGYAEWLHDLIVNLKQKPVVVGHSMGAIIVSYYVSRYPETVDQDLVLLAPVFRTKGGKIVGGFLYRGVGVALLPFSWQRKHKILASRRLSFVISHFLTSDKKYQKMIDEEHFKYSGNFASARSLMGDMKISMKNEVVLPRDKRVLVVFGKKDRLTRYRLVRRRVAEGGVEYHEIEGAGHLINYERPGEVAGRIAEFLGR